MIQTYATLGPACYRVETLEPMLAAGLTGVRLNLSHKTLVECRPWVENLHRAAVLTGTQPELIIDLQGREIRIGELRRPMTLQAGDTVLIGKLGIPAEGDVIAAMRPEMTLLLDDGAIQLAVESVADGSARCRILRGGTLESRKSLFLSDVNLQRPILSDKDRVDLLLAAEYGVTGIMHPFIRDRRDLEKLRTAMAQKGLSHLRVFAKVEDLAGVENLADWLDLADVVTIARGDLGNAMPLWQLPRVQKQISAVCRAHNKPFLLVTHLLESMTYRPIPSRAEVVDIYNACADGAAAVMLTGETAQGKYPVEAVQYLISTVREAEKDLI